MLCVSLRHTLHCRRYKLGLKQKKAKLTSGEKKEARRVKKSSVGADGGAEDGGEMLLLNCFHVYVSVVCCSRRNFTQISFYVKEWHVVHNICT